MADLDYLASSGPRKAWIRFTRGAKSLPGRAKNTLTRFPRRLGEMMRAALRALVSVGLIFLRGDWATKLSFGIMGFGCLRRGLLDKPLICGFILSNDNETRQITPNIIGVNATMFLG